MLFPEGAQPVRSSWAWCLLPITAALVFHLNTLRAGYVLDDAAIEKAGDRFTSLDPQQLFLTSYFSPERIDPGYRPLTYLTFAVERRLGAGALAQHAVNVLLHATAAFLAFRVLRELLGGAAAAPLAATGAAIFAALPVVTDAVARISGRAELLAGIATLGAWLIALWNAPARSGERERALGILAAGAVTFAGLFAKENAVMSVPFLIVASSWLKRRRIPWQTVATCACAVVGQLALRGVLAEGRLYIVTVATNPLVHEDFLMRSLNGFRILALHALKIIAPLNLSTEYTAFDVPVRAATDYVLWMEAAAVLAAILGATICFRRRAPLAALASLLFFLALAPSANIFCLAGSIFQQRAAYVASLSWPLAICAAVQSMTLRPWRRATVILSFILLAVYGTRAVARNEAWVRADLWQLTLTGSPGRTRTVFHAYGELQEKARPIHEKRELRELALAEAARKLEIDSSDGWTEALQGHVLSLDGKRADAVEHLTKAEYILASLNPPIADALLYQLRGDANFALGKFADACKDLDRYIRMLESEGERPDGTYYNRRGLTLAQAGNLNAALADFNTALSVRQDLPETWNNRGFCHFKLNDLDGALTDYKNGLTLCLSQGTIYAASGESVHAFLLRIADVYSANGRQHIAEQDEDAARTAFAEAAKIKAEADRIASEQAPRTQKPQGQ